MPEGPEIKREADALGAVLNEQIIEHVEFGLPHLQPWQKDIEGSQVLRVTNRGKAMLIHLENGLSIYSHNQLYGVWRTGRRGKLPPTGRSLRLALHTHSYSAVLYSASDISIWPTERLEEQPLLAKLGPDILSEQFNETRMVARLHSDRFKRRRLSALFLDQQFVAGIGNYLRSEILFFASLHPDLRPVDLSEQQRVLLAHHTLQVSHRSYITGGYTVDESRHRAAVEQHKDFEKSRFMVFDRENQACRICVTPIERIERNGRRLYLCPHCQPLKTE